MLFPEGEIVYEGLNTSFTNFDELLSVLRKEYLTGVIYVTFNGYNAALFLESGEIIEAVEEFDSQQRSGQNALNMIYKKIKEKEGKIQVFKFSADFIIMFAGTVEGEIVYKNLSGEFIKLLDSLKTMQHTGYVEILDNGSQHLASVFIHAGDLIYSIVSTNGKVTTKNLDRDDIIDLVKTRDVSFNVFKININENKVTLLTIGDIQPLLSFWEQLIGIVKNKLKQENFDKLFKDALLKQADNYPFLDPFRDQFRYKDGKISYDGDISATFNEGLGEVFKTILTPHAQKVKTELAQYMESQDDFINKYSLQQVVQNIVTSD